MASIYKGEFHCSVKQCCDIQTVHQERAWPMLSPTPALAWFVRLAVSDLGLHQKSNSNNETVLKPMPLSTPSFSFSTCIAIAREITVAYYSGSVSHQQFFYFLIIFFYLSTVLADARRPFLSDCSPPSVTHCTSAVKTLV